MVSGAVAWFLGSCPKVELAVTGRRPKGVIKIYQELIDTARFLV
jgi:hypothetical protein